MFRGGVRAVGGGGRGDRGRRGGSNDSLVFGGEEKSRKGVGKNRKMGRNKWKTKEVGSGFAQEDREEEERGGGWYRAHGS